MEGQVKVRITPPRVVWELDPHRPHRGHPARVRVVEERVPIGEQLVAHLLGVRVRVRVRGWGWG